MQPASLENLVAVFETSMQQSLMTCQPLFCLGDPMKVMGSMSGGRLSVSDDVRMVANYSQMRLIILLFRMMTLAVSAQIRKTLIWQGTHQWMWD